VSRRRLAQGAASTRPRTDAELGHLKGLSNLEGLSLWRIGVTGTGFSHLKWLTGLQSLHLYNTQITDAGPVQPKGMTELQQLVLTDTQVTCAGVADLKKTLPSCIISR